VGGFWILDFGLYHPHTHSQLPTPNTKKLELATQVNMLQPQYIYFLSHWLPKIGAEKLNLWERDRYLPIYHYGQQKLLPLHHDFIIDADRYHLCQSDRILPTLIVHGTNDDVIPLASSRHFAAQHPLVKLLEVNSDHNLTKFNHYIWQEICKFCYIYSQ
jgi:uncharacterized protein